MTPLPSLLTVGQVVERLAQAGVDVTEETIRNWARQGKIRRVRMPSGRCFFRPEDIDAFLKPEEVAS